MGRELLGRAKFDYVLMAVVVADMIFKPTVNDWPLLVVFAVVVVAGAAYFLTPTLLKGGQAQASAVR
jgi:hypothetical protein